MTNEQAVTLQHRSTDTEFKALAESYGLEVAGPSARRSFLVREPDGQVWLFGLWSGLHGRSMVRGAWTELNVSVMNQTFGLESHKRGSV